MPYLGSRTLRSETFGTMRSVDPAMAGSMAMAMFASPAHRNDACGTSSALQGSGATPNGHRLVAVVPHISNAGLIHNEQVPSCM